MRPQETRQRGALPDRSTSCRWNRVAPTARLREAAGRAPETARGAAAPVQLRPGARPDLFTAARTTSAPPHACRAQPGTAARAPRAAVGERTRPAPVGGRGPAQPVGHLPPARPASSPSRATPRSPPASSCLPRSPSWPPRSASYPAAPPGDAPRVDGHHRCSTRDTSWFSQLSSSSTTRRPAAPSP